MGLLYQPVGIYYSLLIAIIGTCTIDDSRYIAYITCVSAT